ncbi:methyl-accepting chemotaxis protein [Desulfosporosinus burensis]
MENRATDKYERHIRYTKETLKIWEGKIDWRLQYLISLAPLLRQLTVEDLGIAIADREKFLIYLAGDKLDIKIKPGDTIPPQLPIQEAMKEARRVLKVVDKESFGIPYIAISIPILGDEGKVIGGIAVQQSMEHKENLRAMSRQISQTLSTLTATIQELTAQGEELSATSQQFAAIAQTSQEGVKETDKIVQTVKSISDRSKILGINSAIEAARAGAEGKGFSIVALEIRKLAEQSASSITEIKVIIEEFSQAIAQIATSATELDQVAGQQAAHLSQFTTAIENLSELSIDLANMAEALSREN